MSMIDKKVEQHFDEVEQVIGDVTIEVVQNPVDGRRIQVSCKDPNRMAELVERIERRTGVKPITSQTEGISMTDKKAEPKAHHHHQHQGLDDLHLMLPDTEAELKRRHPGWSDMTKARKRELFIKLWDGVFERAVAEGICRDTGRVDASGRKIHESLIYKGKIRRA
jgi:hypothetical protein